MSPPLTRMRVTGFRAHSAHPEWSHLESLTLITFLKTLSPNQVIYWSGQVANKIPQTG